MIIETLENGDYITLEKDCALLPWHSSENYIKETYIKYDKNGNFIYSWREYVKC